MASSLLNGYHLILLINGFSICSHQFDDWDKLVELLSVLVFIKTQSISNADYELMFVNTAALCSEFAAHQA
jgi:hypothetical protein